MHNISETPYHALKRIFHEPNRMAIVSALCAERRGLTFLQLKRECGLTDGNLSRHLKALEDAGMIDIRKHFVGSRPRTTIHMTDSGRDGFVDYLKALEEVLKQAAAALGSESERDARMPGNIKTAQA